MTQQHTERVVHRLVLGRLEAVILRHEERDGSARHTASFERLECDADGQWRRHRDFGRVELRLLIELAERAHAFILEQSRQDRAIEPRSTGDPSNEPIDESGSAITQGAGRLQPTRR